MDKCYSIEVIDGIAITRFFRKATMSEIIEAMNEVLENHLSPLRLWEFKAGADVDSNQIKDIARYGQKIWPVPSRAAIVASDNLSFGLARIHDAYRVQELHETRVFRTVEAALQWLREEAA